MLLLPVLLVLLTMWVLVMPVLLLLVVLVVVLVVVLAMLLVLVMKVTRQTLGLGDWRCCHCPQLHRWSRSATTTTTTTAAAAAAAAAATSPAAATSSVIADMVRTCSVVDKIKPGCSPFVPYSKCAGKVPKISAWLRHSIECFQNQRYVGDLLWVADFEIKTP
jgi:uncharacterized protein (UPF0333 family)